MGLLVIDDHDPQVSYSTTGNWALEGVNQEYDHTVTWTNITGATATLTFTGTDVAVYGTIAPVGHGTAPTSSYSVDGGPPTLYTATLLSTTQYQHQFFQSKALSAGAQHTLVVTTVGNGGHLYLDFFQVTPVDASAGGVAGSSSSSPTFNSGSSSSSSLGSGTVSGSGSGSSSSSSSSSSLTSTLTSGSSITSTSSSSPTSASASQTQAAAQSESAITTGLKAGIIVIALAFLAVIFILIIFLRRRRRKALREKRFGEKETHSFWTQPQGSASHHISPFLMDPAPTPLSNTRPNTTSHLSPYPQFSTGSTPTHSPTTNTTFGSGGGVIMHDGVLYAPLPVPQHPTSLVIPALSEKRQQQQQALSPGSKSVTSGSAPGWGSESGTASSLSGAYGDTHTPTGTASAISESQPASKVQRQSIDKSQYVAVHDNLFEPPPPQYDRYA